MATKKKEETKTRFQNKCDRCGGKFRSTDKAEKLCSKHRTTPLKGGTSDQAKKPGKEAKLDVQALVNALYAQHGSNLVNRADYAELLAGVGLEKQQITTRHLQKAAQAVEVEEKPAPLESAKNSALAWGLEPTQEKWGEADCHSWTTECGRFQVRRIDSPARERIEYAAYYKDHHSRWTSCETTKEGVGYPKYFKSLEGALESAEKFHQERAKVVFLTSNRDQALAQAHALGLDNKRKGGKGGAAAKAPGATEPGTQGGATPSSRKSGGEGQDIFGNRKDSKHATLCACLTSELKSMAELLEAAGLTKSQYNHLNKLARNDVIRKEGNKFALKEGKTEEKKEDGHDHDS